MGAHSIDYYTVPEPDAVYTPRQLLQIAFSANYSTPVRGLFDTPPRFLTDGRLYASTNPNHPSYLYRILCICIHPKYWHRATTYLCLPVNLPARHYLEGLFAESELAYLVPRGPVLFTTERVAKPSQNSACCLRDLSSIESWDYPLSQPLWPPVATNRLAQTIDPVVCPHPRTVQLFEPGVEPAPKRQCTSSVATPTAQPMRQSSEQLWVNAHHSSTDTGTDETQSPRLIPPHSQLSLAPTPVALPTPLQPIDLSTTDLSTLLEPSALFEQLE